VLIDIRPTDSFTLGEIEQKRMPPGESDIYSWTERMLGNFDLGRWGWVLEQVQEFERPIIYKGARGLFDVADGLFDVPDEVTARSTLPTE
jgi:hypothetical protein